MSSVWAHKQRIYRKRFFIIGRYRIIPLAECHGRRAVIKQSKQNSVRIIGGKWRGRKLRFEDSEGLRPSKDFVRETLFNWLSPLISGSRCLDLFAGSGALGFEAASRGAAKVVMVERAAAVVQCLKQQADILQADNLDIYPQSAESFLVTAVQPFDIVFLDPPFGFDLLQAMINALHQQSLLNNNAVVYTESVKGEALPELPEGWRVHREKQMGQVSCRLFKVAGEDI